MKNVFIPLILGVILGVIPTYLYLNRTCATNCFICLDQKDFNPEKIVGFSKDSLEKVLMESFEFTSNINGSYDAAFNKTIRIDKGSADSMRNAFYAGCSSLDTAVFFDLKPLMHALMSAKGITTIQSAANEMDNLGFFTVFARYPNNFPDPNIQNRYTSIIQFGQRSGTILNDVMDYSSGTGEVIRFNLGTLCPNECPQSLREP